MVGRQNQGEQYGSNEETFVDLVATDHGEQDFPETTNDEYSGVDWHEEAGTIPHLHQPAALGSQFTTEHFEQANLPYIWQAHTIANGQCSLEAPTLYMP